MTSELFEFADGVAGVLTIGSTTVGVGVGAGVGDGLVTKSLQRVKTAALGSQGDAGGLGSKGGGIRVRFEIHDVHPSVDVRGALQTLALAV